MLWFENCDDEMFETENLVTSDEDEYECEQQDYAKENRNPSENKDNTQHVTIGKKRRFDELDLLCYEEMPEKTTENVVNYFYSI